MTLPPTILLPTTLPRVTVLVPARNEEHDIAECLHAVLDQTYPRDRMQVVVVDGNSTDRTAEIAQKVLASEVEHVVLVNDVGTTPSNLNRGLEVAEGELLCRVDARSFVPRDYVERCAAVLGSRPEVVVVGGSQVAVARADDAMSLGITRALNNRWGMGLSRYRRGAASGPADTVYLGAFRTDELVRMGGWDETFSTNQDFELNRRMAATGMVWFETGLDVGYRPRRSLSELARQYQRFGQWKAEYWRRTSDRPRPRQLVLLAAPPVALAGLAVTTRLPRSQRWLLVVGAAAAAVGFEVKGPTGPRAPVRGHLVSFVASAAIGGGWTLGAWKGWFTSRSAR